MIDAKRPSLKIGFFLVIAPLGLSSLTFARPGESYLVGMGQEKLISGAGVPLAGYGGLRRRQWFSPFGKDRYNTYFRPSLGQRDAPRSKAIIIEVKGEAEGKKGKKVLILSLDLIGVTLQLRKDVLQIISPLGFTSDNTLITATHTHSGPGALTQNKFLQLLAADRFHPQLYQSVLKKIAASVKKAHQKKLPAQIAAIRFPVFGLQKKRRYRETSSDHQAQMMLIKALKPPQQVIGALLNYALHPTVFGARNLFLSGDIAGKIEREIEKLFTQLNRQKGAKESNPPLVLFLNGGTGDINPAKDKDLSDEQNLSHLSQLFLQQAKAPIEKGLKRAQAIKVSLHSQFWHLKIGEAKVRGQVCLKRSHPLWKFLFSGFSLSLPFPSQAILSQVRIGAIVLATWPGEPTTSLERELKKRSPRQVWPWVVSTANDHLMYFVSAAEYRRGGYEACSSLYGGLAGEKILHEHLNHLRTQRKS